MVHQYKCPHDSQATCNLVRPNHCIKKWFDGLVSQYYMSSHVQYNTQTHLYISTIVSVKNPSK